MKRILILSVGLLAMSGCNELSGLLVVNGPVALKAKKGAEISLARSERDAQLKADSGHHQIVLKIKDDQGNKQEIDFRDDAVEIPTREGSVEIPASISGQQVDLKADIGTSISESSEDVSRESCSVSETISQCREVPVKQADGKIQVQRQCEQTVITRSGIHLVRSHDEITDTSAVAHLIEPVSKAEIARFQGGDSRIERIVDGISPCML